MYVYPVYDLLKHRSRQRTGRRTPGCAVFSTSGLHPDVRLATASDTTDNYRRYRRYTHRRNAITSLKTTVADQYQYRRPPTGRPTCPRINSTTPITSRIQPIVAMIPGTGSR